MADRWPRTAAEVFGKYSIEPEAAKLAAGTMGARAFLTALTAAGRFRDAVMFLAHMLPIRESLWWACECVEDGPPKDACRRYVIEPTDANRRAAMASAEAFDFGTAGATAAVAAFFSAGSLSEPGLPPVPPPDGIAAKTVASAISLAAVTNGPPQQADDRFRAYLTIGQAVADGTQRWPARV